MDKYSLDLYFTAFSKTNKYANIGENTWLWNHNSAYALIEYPGRGSTINSQERCEFCDSYKNEWNELDDLQKWIKQVKALFSFSAFRDLPLFRQWTEDALKNVCFEAQIQEVRNNAIAESYWIQFRQ